MSSKKGRKKGGKNSQAQIVAQGGSRGVNTGPILHVDENIYYSDVVLVEAPACDWITLTSFEQADYGAMWSYTSMVDHQRLSPQRQAKRMQYVGMQGDGWFLGEGKQQGAPHFLLQAWGARAQEVLNYALLFHERSDSVKCTRIDLQATSGRSHAGDIPAVAQALRDADSSEWNTRGPRPQISFYSHDSEADTLYIGGRSSARFWRFYNKEINGGLRLRMELESKSWLAQEMWHKLCEEGLRAQSDLLFGELSHLPSHAREMVADCIDVSRETFRLPRPIEAQVEEARTREWLLETVLPCLDRMLNTSSGPTIRQAFRDVL